MRHDITSRSQVPTTENPNRKSRDICRANNPEINCGASIVFSPPQHNRAGQSNIARADSHDSVTSQAHVRETTKVQISMPEELNESAVTIAAPDNGLKSLSRQ